MEEKEEKRTWAPKLTDRAAVVELIVTASERVHPVTCISKSKIKREDKEKAGG